MQCEVWSVECEDFASSLAEKIKRLSREGHGRDRVSLNYRSFMFGKLPPPACPGLCYFMDLCAVIMHFIGTLYAVCVQFIIICSLYAVLKTAYKLHVVLGKLHVVYMQL